MSFFPVDASRFTALLPPTSRKRGVVLTPVAGSVLAYMVGRGEGDGEDRMTLPGSPPCLAAAQVKC